ncbi:MAG: SAM-dependent methyltransferase [Clostridia bacterium]|nr:SAM-dependent methyltransferase [Clostridia bacterium]
MDPLHKIATFSEYVKCALLSSTLVNLTVTSLPVGEVSKIKGTPKIISGRAVLQLEYFMSEGRVKHENVLLDEIPDMIASLKENGAKRFFLVAANGNASLLVSKKGDVNITSKFSKVYDAVNAALPVGNNKRKEYIFDGSESFMTKLGISDAKGRVHDKMQSKFRQINRFAEQVRDVMKYLPPASTIHIYDLCCGKSYLSFAVYSYITEKLSRNVEMICVDLKESVMRFCTDTARELGYDGMKFICSDVSSFEPDTDVDLVISLHACDTATDTVLDFAVRYGAKVILSTPCCQREMFGIMDSPELEFISKYSILKQKIASAATDALRLAKLEASGYKTDAIELIDPDDTPKNVLLRGILRDRRDPEMLENKKKLYESSYKFMTGVIPEIDRY